MIHGFRRESADVPVGTLRDWEQARVTTPDFAIAYVRLMARHPDMVSEAVG